LLVIRQLLRFLDRPLKQFAHDDDCNAVEYVRRRRRSLVTLDNGSTNHADRNHAAVAKAHIPLPLCGDTLAIASARLAHLPPDSERQA
jgi:hypothetical protein